jgi:hypothetical protein
MSLPTIPPFNPVVDAEIDIRKPAGAWWCEQYPTDRTTAGLEPAFRAKVQRCINDLERGVVTPMGKRCKVTITSTRRPYLRALLMRRCWEIVREKKDPDKIPVHADLPIRWTREGAAEMFEIYGLVARPSLNSKHIAGLAIDCRIEGWPGTRAALEEFGRVRGVIALGEKDPVHWSDDGH